MMSLTVNVKFLKVQKRQAYIRLRAAKRKLNAAERKYFEAKAACRGTDQALLRLKNAGYRHDAAERAYLEIDKQIRAQAESPIYSVPAERLDEVVIRRVGP